MLRKSALFFGVGMLSLASLSPLPVEASFANGTVVNQAAQDIDATMLVRDGCGRGRHYSRYRGMCVWNGNGGYRVYGYPAYAYPFYGYPVYGYRRGYYYRGW